MSKKINELEQISKQTQKFIDDITDASEKLDKKSSSTLFGVIGGALGALVGATLVPLVLPYLAIPVLLTSSATTLLGICSGVLYYRKDNIALEKLISKNTLASEEIINRINNLPKNAPEETRQLLWHNYNVINGAFMNESISKLSTKKMTEENSNLLEQIKEREIQTHRVEHNEKPNKKIKSD